MVKKKSLPLALIAFLQALGVAVYCGLVALIFWRGEDWFGTASNFLSPTFILMLFVTSALVSALLVLGYPFILFWEKDQPTQALKLVGFTTAWLVLFGLFIISTLIILS